MNGDFARAKSTEPPPDYTVHEDKPAPGEDWDGVISRFYITGKAWP